VQASVPVPWFRRLSAGLSSRGPKFDPGPFRIAFMVDKLALPSFFSECAISGFPCQVIPPVLRTHRLTSNAVVRRTSGVKSGKRQTKHFCFGYREVLERKVGLLSYFCKSEDRAMSQAASRRPFTAKPRVPSRAGPCELCIGLCGMRKCFRRVLRLSPVTVLFRRPGFNAGLTDVEVMGCQVAPRPVHHQIPIYPLVIIFSSTFHTHIRTAFIRMSKELDVETLQ